MMRAKRKGMAEVAFLIYTVVEVCFLPTAHAYSVFQPESAHSLNEALASSQSQVVADRLRSWKINLLDKKVENLGKIYLLSRPADPRFIEIYERLPEGGFGRLLRWRGSMPDGRWIDIEFAYQDAENRVTILDHAGGKFFQVVLKENRRASFCLFPSRDKKGFDVDLKATRPLLDRLFPGMSRSLDKVLVRAGRLTLDLEIPSAQEMWSRRLVRGPPLRGFKS